MSAMDAAEAKTPFSSMSWEKVEALVPSAGTFFEAAGLDAPEAAQSVQDYVALLSQNVLDGLALDAQSLVEAFEEFAQRAYAASTSRRCIGTIHIAGGRAKDGSAESLDFSARPGDVVCVVGPTGSGKSRFLGDIECLAQGDTPTGRRVLLDGREPTDSERFDAGEKLVAQLSQSMGYMLDLSAGEFLELHARSRRVDDASARARAVLEKANTLCGEPFDASTPVCSLSGGQSRALMIADVALLSSSPIVLVDELENAGVDRRSCLDLLAGEGKVVFLSTHDPLLMLMGSRRIVMSGGAVQRVVERTEGELACLAELERQDARLCSLREKLRAGGTVSNPSAVQQDQPTRGEELL